MPYKTENTQLVKSYLDRTFFRAWKDPSDEKLLNYRSVELILNHKCDLACKYCYMNKFHKQYFPEGSEEDDSILENLNAFLEWLDENGYKPPTIELFSGDTLSQNVGHTALWRCIHKINWPCTITVPTNMNFLFSSDYTSSVERAYEVAASKGIRIALSASVDGTYMEDNRPPISKEKLRDGIFYDKLFRFCKKYGIAFHPMLYSNGIEKWKDNFLWFQENFKVYGIPWHFLYLLEVRNKEWDDAQIKDLYEFVRFLVRWYRGMFPNDDDFIANVLSAGMGFNILSSPFTTIGRGFGCSLQANIGLRLGDLTAVPCHRQAYKQLDAFRFIKKGGKIVDIEGLNVDYYLTSMAMRAMDQPYCETCLIRHVCLGGCPGSQLETTGDAFTPIPSVCKLLHIKLLALLREYKQIGILGKLLGRISKEKRDTVQIMMEEGMI